MAEEFPTIITSETKIKFKISRFGLYSVSVTASCEKGHDLRIGIDDKQFRETPSEKNIQKHDIPPSWNGTRLRGLKKTVFFILRLGKGEHTITFFPKDRAVVEQWDYRSIRDIREITFDIEEKAEDGDRRPWFTFALVDLPLKSITAEASVSWHFFDGDDVKLIIDNDIERNPKSRFWKYWVWHATPLQVISGAKRELKVFGGQLSEGIHYIEFWADRVPTLHQVVIDLGNFELKRLPTEDDPKWTGNFDDDTEVMLLSRAIYGEAGGESREAKTAVGWTIRNRVEDKKGRWGKTYHDVILAENQYDAFWNPRTFDKVRNPPITDPVEKEAWEESYNSAKVVIKGRGDPTRGANHFYATTIPKPNWADENRFIIQIGITRFYIL